MVRCIIVSLYQDGTPPEGLGDRKIKGGPLYSRQDLEPLLVSRQIQTAGGAQADLLKWSMDTDDIAGLIRLALVEGRYLGAEWCRLSNTKNTWAACDAYSVIERRYNEYSHKAQATEFYLKFAIGKTGQIILTISCHPSRA